MIVVAERLDERGVHVEPADVAVAGQLEIPRVHGALTVETARQEIVMVISEADKRVEALKRID